MTNAKATRARGYLQADADAGETGGGFAFAVLRGAAPDGDSTTADGEKARETSRRDSMAGAGKTRPPARHCALRSMSSRMSRLT